MLIYVRIISALLVCSLLNSACNSTAEKNTKKLVQPDTISIVKNSDAFPEKPMLKETVLDEKTVITGKRLITAAKVDKERYNLLAIKIIDSAAVDENGFSYHMVDTLLSVAGIKVFLIGRAYESENVIWIAVYDDANKLLDHKTVYYDNAEGFLSVKTIIKNNRLTIITFNEYDEHEKEKHEIFHLNEYNKIVKLN